MTKEQFLVKMQEEVLDTDQEITMESTLEELDEWDSLAFVSYIAMANTAAGKKVDRTAVQVAVTVGDLYALLQ